MGPTRSSGSPFRSSSSPGERTIKRRAAAPTQSVNRRRSPPCNAKRNQEGSGPSDAAALRQAAHLREAPLQLEHRLTIGVLRLVVGDVEELVPQLAGLFPG